MKIGKRATLLAAGASVIAIGCAAPAFAQNYRGTSDIHVSPHVNNSITINLGALVDGGDTDSPALNTNATAYVDGGTSATAVDFGGFVQFGSSTAPNADATIGLYVAGTALESWGAVSVRADAAAYATTGAVDADASIVTAVDQYAVADRNVTVGLTNGGVIDAIASAYANSTGSEANANASITRGISQDGNSIEGGNEAMSLTNNGTINIRSSALASATAVNDTDTSSTSSGAYATASAGANADASIDTGISQLANSGVTTVALTNSGEININAEAGAYVAATEVSPSAFASANAYATTSDGAYADALAGANAYADVENGISQVAGGVGSASVSLTNSGSINIGATADAGAPSASALAFASASDSSAFATAYAGANADANIGNGIYQSASLESGAATVSLTNNGAIDISAAADADGYSAYADAEARVWDEDSYANAQAGAIADAYISNGISQQASGSTAGVTLGNGEGDSINVSSLANAGADWAAAYANAYASISDSAYANAFAGADAHAGIGNGIYQYASASSESGAGTVGLTNAGLIDVDATATANADNVFASAYATATSDAGAYASAGANAYANIENGINQQAYGATAGVTLSNSGTIDIAAAATATSYSADALADANANSWVYADASATAGASAGAYIGNGINQYASTSGGAATVGLTNDGLIDISAVANATGDNAFASAGAYANDWEANADAYAGASADAYISKGINQEAYGSTAGVTLYNSDTINIAAVAEAAAYSADAQAGANAYTGADASATAGAEAYAGIGTGIYQYASAEGGTATVGLTNDGLIDISAVAVATGDNASATANAYAGWYGSDAEAKAGAYADASIENGINQQANGPTAGVTLTNNDTINITAAATAYADSAHANATANNSWFSGSYANAFAGADASAYVDSGIYQAANGGYGESGSGSVTLTNIGLIDISAVAHASAYNASASVTSYGYGDADAGAYASAYVGTGIYQQAYGQAAEATLGNSGTITVAAEAGAFSLGADAVVLAYYSGPSFAGADAEASVGNGIYQYASGPSAEVDLQNSGTIDIGAGAGAYGNVAYANADVESGIYQQAYGTDASVNLTNSLPSEVSVADLQGILVHATAYAFGSTADASAVVGNGVYQSAEEATSASAELTNSSLIAVEAFAGALGQFNADATAYAYDGIDQYANGSESAQVVVTNEGTISLLAQASAYGENATAYAYAGTGVDQYASGGDIADAIVDNSGTISVEAIANAQADNGYADAYADHGVYQGAYTSNEGGLATVLLTNTSSESIDVTAFANVEADTYANADAYVNHGVHQDAGGETATLTLNNTGGAINVHATAYASVADTASGDYFGNAYAYATVENGVLQNVEGGTATVSLTNSGSIDVGAGAVATGQYAYAEANVNAGVDQYAAGNDVSVSFVNSNDFLVHATATANGSTAYASAYAVGVNQVTYGESVVLATFNNTSTGSFTVTADATANGDYYGSADAMAAGLIVEGDPVEIAITNANDFSVTASAAGDDAAAEALGIGVFATNFGYTSESSWAYANSIGGTLNNSGTLTVAAIVDETPADLSILALTSAMATGVYMQSAVNTATLTNTGRIEVMAQTNGLPAFANGIIIDDYAPSPVVPAEGDTFTLNNTGGAIIARKSTDGGTTWQRGTAINTSNAPNQAVINLTANGSVSNGYVYGNVLLSGDDAINVSNGETKFDGVVNPGVEAGTGTGSLTIASGGTLYLVDQPHESVTYNGVQNSNDWYDGPAGANVESFTVASGGTLALQLPTSPEGGAQSTYPVVTADTATLGATSTLQIRPSSWNGLYDDSYTFDNIINANDLSGTFGTVTTHTGTPLLTFAASYDGSDNVDLTMTRVAFGAVSGLTNNQSSVGDGIESVYDPELTGPFATLLGALFTQNTATYQNSLDQLSGAQYAGYLQSLNGMAGRFNSLISSVTDCPATQLDNNLACRRDGGGRIWGQINYGETKKDGDIEATGYKAKQYYIALGADFEASPGLVLGLSGAYVKNDLDFNRFSGRIKSDGYQIGGYAVYDPGNYYLKAIASYTDLNGDSSRSISISSAETVPANAMHDATTPTQDNTIAGALTGHPDAHAFSAYGEAGYRIGMGSSILTPYVGIEYTWAKLKGFTETGVAAANLHVFGGKQDRAASQLGLKWGGQFGKVSPEVKLGWRHQFGSVRAAVDSEFAIMPGSEFTVLSPSEKRDAALVDVGLTAELGKNIVGKIGYQGRLNGDADSHAGGATLIIRFGGSSK